MTGLLDEKTRTRAEELAARGRWYDALDLVQDQVEGAIDLGLISREQMRADLELALLVARLDLGAAEYEAWQQAVQWLARLEEQGQGNLEWCRSLALARLYTGAPEEALRLARMGLNLNHQDETCRYLAAVLAAHFGEKTEGIALLEEGLAACPGQRRFADALERLQAGQSIEQIEAARLEAEGICPAQSEERASHGLRTPAQEAVLCMLGDDEGLAKAAVAFGAENPLFEGIYCFADLAFQGNLVNLRLDMNQRGAGKISADWAAALAARLEELDRLAKAAIRKKEPGRRLELAHLLVERSGCFRLGYQVGRSREERLFAYQRFDPHFEPWGEPQYEDYSADELPLPPEEEAKAPVPAAAYTKEQKDRLIEHLRRWLGPVNRVIPPAESGGVELLVLGPHRHRHWTVLVTCGMGAAPMNVPPELAGFGAERAEIMMYLPPHWNPLSADPQDAWPVGWLRLLAAMPREQGTWLGWGHTIPNGRPFAPGCGFTGVILLTPGGVPDAAAVCPLPGGGEVNLYQAAPLYNEEMAYKLEHEAEGLLRLFDETQLEPRAPLSDPLRPNACPVKGGAPENEALLEQIEAWNADRQYERILEAILAVELGQRGAKLLGQQARALNNLGRFEEALQVLEQCKEQSAADPLWHFRAGYAWYHLGKEEKALEAFDRADELAPGDEETERYLDWCRSAIALPVQKQPFTERVQDYWAAFSAREAELRALSEAGENEKARQAHAQLLAGVFGGAEFSLDTGPDGRLRLAVWAECMPTRLIQILYWRERAPEALAEHWVFWPGHPADLQAPALEGVLAWPEKRGDKAVVALWGPNLHVEQDLAPAARLLSQAMGEGAALCRVERLEVLDAPRPQGGMPLRELRKQMADWFCGGDEAALDEAQSIGWNYQNYCYEPATQEDWALRQDVIAGATCCSELLADYYRGDDSRMDRLQADGVICGFFFYSTEQVPEAQRVELRGRLEDELQQAAGENVWILGGATGFAYSYIDCICFDLKPVLNAASALLNRYPFAEIGFHVFRLNCGGVNLRDENAQPGEEAQG